MKIVVNEDNIRIDKYLSENTEYSRSYIEKLIDEKCVLVNGKEVKASYKVCLNDEIEINDYFKQLMNYKKYNHYLVVLFNSRWTGASGYKIFDNYMECFYRDYDNTMYVKGSSRSGKYLKLREYHHDKPMGHDSIIIGLTDREYEKLDNMNIDEIIDFGKENLFKVENFD